MKRRQLRIILFLAPTILQMQCSTFKPSNFGGRLRKQSGYNQKKVEYVPAVIFRTGTTYAYKNFSFADQYSYTPEQYSDADNSQSVSLAIYELIPAYSVMDFSASYAWRALSFGTGVNNVGNSSFFTRRAGGYPEPGIIPTDPVNLYFTLQVKLLYFAVVFRV